MKRILFLISALIICISAQAQSVADSLAILTSKWETYAPHKGVVHKSIRFDNLFGSPQSINLIEISRSSKLRFAVAHDNSLRHTSDMAQQHNAVTAINGSYYNMREGNSVCFYNIDGEVIDTTSNSEFKNRVNGAIHELKGEIKIIDWNKEIEANYKGKRGTVLASGPIMLEDGHLSDWSACSQNFIDTRHPRSAIYIKNDGTVVFITVDGRSEGNAAGVSIPELAFLIRVLGGKDALNLDGGGSTTLWLKGAPDNGVLNYPSDNKRFDHMGERAVSNIFYVK